MWKIKFYSNNGTSATLTKKQSGFNVILKQLTNVPLNALFYCMIFMFSFLKQTLEMSWISLLNNHYVFGNAIAMSYNGIVGEKKIQGI